MGRFENFTPPTLGSELTISELTTLETLNALANSSAGQFVRKEGGVFVNATLAETIALSGLSDVAISGATSGQVLTFNGSSWVNDDPTGGSGGGGSGTVTLVSVVTANGISGLVANDTTTPAITLTLGAITPSAISVSGLTASEIVITDGSKNLASAAVATYPSLTELTYVKGVTSAIQTQFTGKAALALSNLASVAINTTLVSDTDNTDALGTAAIAWSDLYLGSGSVITWTSAPSTADVTLTHSAGKLTFGGDGAVEIDFNNHEMTNIDINSGAIDGTVIGAASAAAGTFTTVGGTTITASTGFALGDGDYIGVTSNEIITFATAGTITVSGADFLVADANGVVIGHTAQLVADGITSEFQIIGTSTTGIDSSLLIANFSTTATSPALLIFAKSDQGTPGSFALLDSGDTIGGIHWVADDGVDLTSVVASIMVFVDGTSGSNDMPGRIVFATTADSGVAATDRLILDSVGTLKPAAHDGVALGTTALGFADLFLATGATLHFENTDWVATHTAGILTVGTGDLRITTAGTNSASAVTVGGTQTLTNKTLTSPTLTTPGAFTTGGSITLAENTSIALDPAGSADGKYTGITVTAISGYAQAFGDLVYLDPTDSRWEATDANSAAAADGDARGILGMVVVAGTDGNTCTILLHGIIRADAKFPAMTINAPMYVSETAGLITETKPTTTDNVIRTVGFAITADELFFSPESGYITHV